MAFWSGLVCKPLATLGMVIYLRNYCLWEKGIMSIWGCSNALSDIDSDNVCARHCAISYCPFGTNFRTMRREMGVMIGGLVFWASLEVVASFQASLSILFI